MIINTVSEGSNYDEQIAHLESEVSTINTNLTQTNQNIATIESTNIASQPYVEGEYLIYDGIYYKVTNAIAQGATLQVNTNIKQTTLGAELKLLGIPNIITNPHFGDVLRYNVSSNKWENVAWGDLPTDERLTLTEDYTHTDSMYAVDKVGDYALFSSTGTIVNAYDEDCVQTLPEARTLPSNSGSNYVSNPVYRALAGASHTPSYCMFFGASWQYASSTVQYENSNVNAYNSELTKQVTTIGRMYDYTAIGHVGDKAFWVGGSTSDSYLAKAVYQNMRYIDDELTCASGTLGIARRGPSTGNVGQYALVFGGAIMNGSYYNGYHSGTVESYDEELTLSTRASLPITSVSIGIPICTEQHNNNLYIGAATGVYAYNESLTLTNVNTMSLSICGMGSIDEFLVIIMDSGNKVMCYDEQMVLTETTALGINPTLSSMLYANIHENIGENLMFSAGTTMRGYRLNQGGN